MFLTQREYEAFLRGKASGLIPADLPMPQSEQDIDNLVAHVGLMFSARIAYRNTRMKLRLLELSAFTEEHLENIICQLPFLKYSEVAFLTDFRLDIHLNKLEALRGFQLEVAPPILPGTATIHQKELLAQMICEGRLPTISRRQWENLTKEEAAKLIVSAVEVQQKLPVTVTLVLDAVKRMKPEERFLLEQNLNFNKEREIA